MDNVSLKDNIKLGNIQLINMKTNFENSNIEVPEDIEGKFDVALIKTTEHKNENKNEEDIDLAINIGIYQNEDIVLNMMFVHRLTLQKEEDIDLENVERNELITLCLDYLYPSLRELVNIVCYKMNINPLDIPNFAER